jgi:hypothetical protein
VRHEEHGLRYVYMPTCRATRPGVGTQAPRRDFFDGSNANVVAALLGGDGSRRLGRRSRPHRAAPSRMPGGTSMSESSAVLLPMR